MSERSVLDAAFKDSGGALGVFGGKAHEYASARPGYPDALYAHIEQQLGLTGPLTIADVGAGTGLLTRGWLARGHRAVAVEPNEAMRAQADALLGTHSHYRSVAARAEATGLAEASVDLVTAAQAFHWFDPAAFRAECLRILRPHGRVALIWNDRGDDPLNLALTDLFVEFGGSRRAAMMASNVKGENIDAFFGEGEVHAWSSPHAQSLDRAGFAALAFSRSFMPRPDMEAGAAVTRALIRIFEQHAAGGYVQIGYLTRAFLGRPARSGV